MEAGVAKKMIKNSFLVAQIGARRHYAIPRMLYEAGMLEHFFTDICAVKGWPQLLRMVPDRLQPTGLRRLLGRVPQGVPSQRISAFTTEGWRYVMSRAKAHNFDERAAIDIEYGKRFCNNILKKGFGQATATYSFNSAGLELMQAAKKAGLKAVMEQTIAPRAVEQAILKEATERYPAWAEVLPVGPNIDRFSAREEEEWQFADVILCGSDFVRDGIVRRSGPLEKCAVVPYGVDNRFRIERGPRDPGPLRVLTVGQVGLRKGAPIVWEAARLLGSQAEFRMVGSLALPPGSLSQQPGNLALTGVVPRSEIVGHYQWADVFLLPSLCEGSATVTYEAMLAGLPVVCTPNTGSVVLDGVSGRIVPAFSAEAVAAALQEWINNPDFFNRCREGVTEQIPQLGLDAYRGRLSTQLNNLS